MPRKVDIYQVTEPPEDYVICDMCLGWGGYDRTVCHGFGARDDWMNCFRCGGSGIIAEHYAEYLKSKGKWNA